MLVEPLTPTPHRAVRHTHDLGCFPPLQLPGSRLQYHFLCFHHPLHFRGRNLLFDDIHADQLFPPACSSGHFTYQLTRTTHMLTTAIVRWNAV
jgi:hypothetical protein